MRHSIKNAFTIICFLGCIFIAGPSRADLNDGKNIVQLAAVFQKAVDEAQGAEATGDQKVAREQAAIAMRTLTEAYLVADLNEGSRQGRLTQAMLIQGVGVLALILGSHASFILSEPHIRTAFILLLGPNLWTFAMNVLRDDGYPDTPQSKEPVFFPCSLLRRLDQRSEAKQLRKIFWLNQKSFLGPNEKEKLQLALKSLSKLAGSSSAIDHSGKMAECPSLLNL